MVVQVTKDTVSGSLKPVVIKAFASWCPHCAVMKPIFEKLEKELGKKYVFAEFDVDLAPDFTKQYKVESLPTFIFFKGNKEVGREIGEMSEDELKKHIEKYLG